MDVANLAPPNSLPALTTGRVTFGTLNNFVKVNEPTLQLWAMVMKAVPASQLLLLAPQGDARRRILDVLTNHGIVAERVEFADRGSSAAYFELYRRIDLVLDCFPYNGHTTSLDAFWMGVPVVTQVGRTVVGRAGWSQLCNLNLMELAADKPQRFVQIASELAGNLPRLSELRSTLRQRMQQSPLMDAPRFARNVEAAYLQMWLVWCRSGG
jgi:protein O-GlcNAc transferase